MTRCAVWAFDQESGFRYGLRLLGEGGKELGSTPDRANDEFDLGG